MLNLKKTDKMKNFDFRRCAFVLKYDLLGNGRKYLRGLGGLFLACFIVELLNFYTPSRTGVGVGEEGLWAELRLLHSVSNIMWLMLAFFVLVAAGLLFDPLKTKGGRISFLALPATRMEKYVARWVVAVLLWPAAFLVAFVAADLLRMALCPLLGHSFPSAVPVFFSSMLDSAVAIFKDTAPRRAASFRDLAENWFPLLACLSLHAVYLLGSSFFRKQAFLLTSLTGILLLTVLGFVLAAVEPHHLPAVRYDSALAVLCLADFFLLCFIACCYWLSYRLFSRVQVIQHKWFNV